MRLPASIIDAWIGRARMIEPNAIDAVAGREPAVVVTGGSSGIGLALAKAFASRGHAVVLVARNPQRLAAARAEFVASSRVSTLAVDVSADAAAGQIVTAVAARGQYVDVLVNNAGIGLAGAFVAQSECDIEALLALNVTAPTRLMRHFLPSMLARGRGGILNVASLGGYGPGPWQAAYYASKAYVIDLTEAVAYEARGRGVRIAVAAPGPVATGFHAAMGADGALYRRLIPAMTAEAVARSVVRGYMLGQTVIVPGLVSKLLAVGQRVSPHPLLNPIVGWLLRPPSRIEP